MGREAMRRLTCAVLVVAVWAAAVADAEVEVLSAEEVAPAATAKTTVAAKPNLVQKAHKFVEKGMDKHKETHKKFAHTFGQKVADPHPLKKIFHEIDHMEGPRKKDFPKHEAAVHKTQQDVYFDAQKGERTAHQQVLAKANVDHYKAVQHLKTIEADNAAIRTKWMKVDVAGKDPAACHPVPACLAAKKTCVDTYDMATCIKARKGENNLCKQSAMTQKTCCATCKLSAHTLCVKERLILAGFGDKPDATALVDKAKAHADKLCKIELTKAKKKNA